MDEQDRPTFTHWRDDARDWCRGRAWQPRAVVLLLLVWQAAIAFRDSEGFHVFRGITFGAHEFGHLFFALSGSEWLAVAGGSLMQFLVPLGAAAVMRRYRDWFGVAVCGLWLAASFADLAPYIADARAMDLDLVSFSEEGAVHDWHFLLSRAGWLRYDQTVARVDRFAGFAVLLASLWLGVWLLLQMRTAIAKRSSDSE
ncbi:MAG: hypothetical protein FJ363_06650 [Gemmatimonadetes bacterium]|nr:hypothetical protein [Gemmatimonadota bacterium]